MFLPTYYEYHIKHKGMRFQKWRIPFVDEERAIGICNFKSKGNTIRNNIQLQLKCEQ